MTLYVLKGITGAFHIQFDTTFKESMCLLSLFFSSLIVSIYMGDMDKKGTPYKGINGVFYLQFFQTHGYKAVRSVFSQLFFLPPISHLILQISYNYS